MGYTFMWENKITILKITVVLYMTYIHTYIIIFFFIIIYYNYYIIKLF